MVWRPRVGPLLLACLLLAPLAAGAADKAQEPHKEGNDTELCTCQPAQGAASFGIMYGGIASAVKLRPMDLLRAEAPGSLPLANPVLTPAQLHAADAISEPTLIAAPEEEGGAMHLFFSAHACGSGRWGIAAARSDDGGMSWQPLGWVLQDKGSDLQAPTLFQHGGQWYMTPEVTPAGQRRRPRTLRVYRATTFPTAWKLHVPVLLAAPLAGASVVRHNHKWWLTGHQEGEGLDGQDHVLAIYTAKSPFGPWEPHLSGSFAAESATTMDVFVWRNQLHRLGRTCRKGACGGVEAMFVSAEAFEQDTLQLDLGRPLWRQRASWDSAGWSHLSIEKRADGAWLAVIEASRLPPLQSELPVRLRAAVRAFKALALLSICALVLSRVSRAAAASWQQPRQPMGRRSLLARLLCLPGRRRGKLEHPLLGSHKAAALQSGVIKLIVHSGPGSPSKTDAHHLARPSSAISMHRRSGSTSSGASASSRPTPAQGGACGRFRRACQRFPWGAALAASALLLALGGGAGAQLALRVSRPFLEQLAAVAVHGQYSRFTLMVMSYDARLATLQRYIRHYSQCPSVGEILVVWNRGPPPHPRAAFESEVPVRVRVEPLNSMNNRFRPDPGMKFRSVLSLDDDILMPCSTIEAAFARWRAAPQQLLGFYPRLLLPEGEGQQALQARGHRKRTGRRRGKQVAGSGGSNGTAGSGGSPEGAAAPAGPLPPPVYRFEEFVFQAGQYNAILAGAAFMDSAALFPAYFSAAAAPARTLVDEVFNCDDLLLNFVAANLSRAASSAAASGAAAATAAAAGGKDDGSSSRLAAAEGPEEVLPPVQLMRPQRRIDLSRLSGVGISHNQARFKAAADRCLVEFSRLFGGSPLQLQQLPADYGSPPNCHLWPFDCMYLKDR